MRVTETFNEQNGRLIYRLAFLFFMTLLGFNLSTVNAQQNIRREISLNANWKSIADDYNSKAHNGFEQQSFNDAKWQAVNVPHNWDTYEGYRRLKHGNRHGTAWYCKTFALEKKQNDKRYFLWFEGVGSYATVWLNGKQVGYHAGGRTSFTLDVTDAVKAGKQNLLCVKADHPSFIKDLPWVCGGCSDDPGFSEGSQPMGIFRPVHLIVTKDVRIEPFGVHIWNDTTVREKLATLNLETEVKNYGAKPSTIVVTNSLVNAGGKTITQAKTIKTLNAGETNVIAQQFADVKNVHLWSLEEPYLYQVTTEVWADGKLIDKMQTPYGIHWISWPIGRNNDNRFYLNGKPVFINGIAEYEHLMGKSHAFSDQEIKARVMQVKAAGFNAFRDAHQPHNLAYQQYWDKLGILWWPQYSAHIWYDSPAFRANYKALLVDWVKERRNSPSVILWGLQNESKLPADFAHECSEIIRKLDPTASSQRKITTCNGGEGTDWDVPQNWTGTYGGNPLTYGDDLKKQILVGEYGAWRSLGLHTEGPFNANGPLSEDRMTQLMETKVHLAESVKAQVAGHFQWLLYSHENPGRTQGGEGQRELDRVGPVNYKGLFTPWGQPTDAFYMYRANYAPKDKEPMVYIVSHTWPNRWITPGKKDSIIVYSNCDEVELFNDLNHESLGKRKRQGIGTHFQWDDANIKYNVLYAVGYINGKPVTHDEIMLNHLPSAPHLPREDPAILKPQAGYNYLYRLNCGGPDYTDSYGNKWTADRHQGNKQQPGSISWTDDYPGMPSFFASQQRTFDRIGGTADGELFQTFRYGLDKLKFNFPVPDGDYRIELYFTEPWYGTGGGMDCSGWRLFDVAVNDKTMLYDLDIWKEAGYAKALKKSINAHVTGRMLTLSFPNAAAGEAIISAIAISTLNKQIKPHQAGSGIIGQLQGNNKWTVKSWMDIGQKQYTDAGIIFNDLPPIFYGANWISPTQPFPEGRALKVSLTGGDLEGAFTLNANADVYVAMDVPASQRPAWLSDYENTGLFVKTDADGGHPLPVYRKRFKKADVVTLGENKGKFMYTVVVLPVTSLQPATDLRKTVSYKAETAELKGDGLRPDTLNGKKVVKFSSGAGGSVAFAITPGVADLYALRIKYYNQTNEIFTAKMQLLAADGTLMKEEELSFKPVAKNKSGTVATNTGTSINAGNYKLVITGIKADGLAVSGIEMQ
ncbi:Glycosyl hydrolases family 2, TIM barrel domain [Mucilaginibacter sp. OK268]|uniref:malectin domain-containing carbohydrate-binding protein n=1 Tax=Mucilaginibacter sp. OK268 TaxID=1881048 RepID=UPI00089139AA|nr:malectin domain-containing carbohydrate-binding protein [Mucilaginibacter sp. OK268]SDP11283.1 Glycosyl hydrolases family 2, TIM barrel domain [Mucilaginibacter sp. OK268]